MSEKDLWRENPKGNKDLKEKEKEKENKIHIRRK